MQMLRLSDPQSGAFVDISVPDLLLSAFRTQIERDLALGNPVGFQARVEAQLVQVVTDSLEYELQPPTPKQLRYAGNIAGRLRISIPAAALASKAVMATFIDQHVAAFVSRARPRSRRIQRTVSVIEREVRERTR
jgi:hypothetical protein